MTSIPTLATAISALTAILGTFAAYLAYRGARRNDSPTMRALAVGVVCIAVLPFLIASVLGPWLALTDAQTFLGVTLSHTLGLFAVYRTFDR